jgi:hypothetical protein
MELDRDDSVIYIGMMVSLGLSALGSIFVGAVYLYFTDIRSFAFKLVFYLSLMDLCHAIGFSIPPGKSVLCQIQAAVTSYFSLSSVLWTGVIALTLYLAVMKDKRDVERLELRFILFANGLPFLALIPPLAQQQYGLAQGWCWIKAKGEYRLQGTIWRVVTFYLPLWLVIAFNSFVYYKIIKNVKQDVGLLGSDIQLAQKLIQKLRMYPFILIFCYSLATINRIYDFIRPDNMNFWLTFCAAVIMSLCGLLNAVVYGFTDTVRTRIKHWLQGRPMQDISVTGSINSEAAV